MRTHCLHAAGTLAVVIVLAALTSTASGSIIFGFDTNFTADPNEVFTYTGRGGTLQAHTTVDLSVNIGGDVTVFDDADFDFVGSWVSDDGVEEVFLDGNFVYTASAADGGQVVLSGSFVGAEMEIHSTFGFAGASNGGGPPNAMDYTPGPAFLALPAASLIVDLIPIEDMSFSLTQIAYDPQTNPVIDGFSAASSSFSGSAQAELIPEPSSVALLGGLGLLGAWARRRRHSR